MVLWGLSDLFLRGAAQAAFQLAMDAGFRRARRQRGVRCATGERRRRAELRSGPAGLAIVSAVSVGFEAFAAGLPVRCKPVSTAIVAVRIARALATIVDLDRSRRGPKGVSQERRERR